MHRRDRRLRGIAGLITVERDGFWGCERHLLAGTGLVCYCSLSQACFDRFRFSRVSPLTA